MQTLEASLIALLEASDKTQRALAEQLKAQSVELTQVNEELKAREKEATDLRLSLEQLHGLLETSLTLQKGLETRLLELEKALQKA